MNYTPLIPPPSDQASNTQTPDPFEELLREPMMRPSNTPPNRPLFPQGPSRTSPIRIPTLRSNSILITPPSSTESEFGAFVCVPPTHDPLASPFFSHSPKTSKTALSEIAFVDEARRRTNSSEKRLVGEILTAEKENRRRATQTGKLPAARSESFGEFQATDVREGGEAASFLGQSPGEADLRSSGGLVTLSSTPTPRPSSIPAFAEEHPPGMASKRSSSSSALYRMNGSTPFASTLSSRWAQTLPKKWGNLLSSTLSSSPTPSNSSSPEPSVPDVSCASSAPITHTSPFASHPFVPSDGAPGFDGDRNWDKGFTYSTTQSLGDSVSLVGRNESARIVLPLELVECIRGYLPPLYRLERRWVLLYSLDQHGISLGTLYARVSQFITGGCLVAVKDGNDAIFGAWIGAGIRRSVGESYYGSGESFLWKQADTDFLNGNPTKVQVFKWTGKNDYVALCLPDSISFGGGDGKYGLFLDSDILDGSSATCPTFDNDVLCSDPEDGKGTARFECVGLEVWGIAR